MNREAPVNNCASQASQWVGTSNHVLPAVRSPHPGLSIALQGSISDLGTWGTFQMGQGPHHTSYFSWGFGIVQYRMFSPERPELALREDYQLNLILTSYGSDGNEEWLRDLMAVCMFRQSYLPHRYLHGLRNGKKIRVRNVVNHGTCVPKWQTPNKTIYRDPRDYQPLWILPWKLSGWGTEELLPNIVLVLWKAHNDATLNSEEWKHVLWDGEQDMSSPLLLLCSTV